MPVSIIYITLALVFGVITKLANRHVLKSHGSYGFAFFFNFGSALLFLPFALKDLSFPHGQTPYISLGIACLLWTLQALFSFISYKNTEVSLREPVGQSRLIWVMLFGFFVLGEPFRLSTMLGTILIFLGISVALFHPERKFGDWKNLGVRWTFLAALFSSLVAIADKFSLSYFNPVLYAFFVYLIPALLLFVFGAKRHGEITAVIKTHLPSATIATISGALGYYFTLKTFTVLDITIAFPLLQLISLFAVVGGMWVLKEKENFTLRIVGTAITIVGVILLK